METVPHRRRHPTETISYLTQDEVQALFEAIRTAKLPTRTRDLALFTFVYKYGLRASEVGLLTLQDADLDRGKIRLKRLKGGVASEWPLFRDVQRHLKAYLATRTDRSLHLFPSRQQGRPLGRKRLDQLYRFYAGLAGLPQEKRHVHCLRHSIATHLLDAGQPMELVADLLGHKNLQSTQVYAKITPRRREAAFQEVERSREVVKIE